MGQSKFQRDAFFDRLYERAKEDKDVVLVVADMSAPALDKFRLEMPTQFINVGIAEQNAIQIASGLALAGKKVFAYAISPFITLRALEQIRVSNCIMGIPITIVGMGTGLSYENDGPTHHLIEDIAVMRAFPNMTIYNITDNVMATAVVDICCDSGGVDYVRLDKDAYPDVYDTDCDFSYGMSKRNLEYVETVIITSGAMYHVALEVSDLFMEKGDIGIGVVDIFRIPIGKPVFLERIKNAKRLVTLEEHFLAGGLGSAVCEILVDEGITVPLLRIGMEMDNGYKFSYKYGGRDIIRKWHGIDVKSVTTKVFDFIKEGTQ
jgi:transketolase